jgi:hypothetical protein
MIDMPIKTLNTWGGKSGFEYIGSVKDGTTIKYGAKYKYKINVTMEQYAALINHFIGQTVQAGTSRTDPPRGSVGDWLQEHVTPTAISSYVCAILIEEGYAERVGKEIKFY